MGDIRATADLVVGDLLADEDQAAGLDCLVYGLDCLISGRDCLTWGEFANAGGAAVSGARGDALSGPRQRGDHRQPGRMPPI